jgi:penicillin-binding protein 1A
VQAGFLAQDPVNGHVLAWVGSRDFGIDPYDHVAAARRQPGSTFKPFVYGAAFAQGASPNDALMDSAIEIPLGGGRVWRPTDGRAPSDEPMTLADGLAYSKNTITAQVMQQVGPARVAEVARALGVRQSPLEEVPSLALGTSPVTLKEMIAAYCSIVNLGRYVEPVLITRIEDKNGKVLETFAPSTPEPVFDARAAQTLRNTMRGGVDRGTATAIRSRYGIQADVAGKTGTTQDNTDGWFILMSARVVAGAWAGFNDGRITLRSDYWGHGARSALPIVGEFVQQGLRARVINGNERFVDEFAQVEPPPPQDAPLDTMRNWIRGLFGGGEPASVPPALPPGALPRVTTDDAPALPAKPMPPPKPRVPSTPVMPSQEWTGA